MAKGPDNDEKRDPPLSAKAREIKRQIDEGRYDIDLAALADALVNAGALDVTTGPAPDEDGSRLAHDDDSGLALSDQKPGKV